MILKNYTPKEGFNIFTSDGVLVSRKRQFKRTFISYKEIPQSVINAFVSAEDKNYFEHEGIDPTAILRAMIQNKLNGTQTGGSTITQQVAKNILVGNEKSLSRKIKEAILAMRIDKDIGKEKTLEIYLNEIYLGEGSYGIIEAAETYFGKKITDLSISETAMIAAMPKAPSTFNPYRNPTRAIERRNYVITRMYDDKKISKEEFTKAINEGLQIKNEKSKKDLDKGQEGWFDDLISKQISDVLPKEIIDSEDFEVTTTLNSIMQHYADLALKKGIRRADEALGWRGPLGHVKNMSEWNPRAYVPPPGTEDFLIGIVYTVNTSEATIIGNKGQREVLTQDGVAWTGKKLKDVLKQGDIISYIIENNKLRLTQIPNVDGALIAISPKTGDVLAMIGGFSYEKSKFNRAIQAKRQAGSSFKPILYGTALSLGYDATSPILDAPIVIEQGPGQEDWRPNDHIGMTKGGLITVRRALETSKNTAAARLVWDLGLDELQTIAKKMGFESSRMTNATALGAIDVSLGQMVSAYSAFANKGTQSKLNFIKEIKSKKGVAIYDEKPEQTNIFDEITAAQMASILKGVTERGTAQNAFKNFGHSFAGKTGTTNNARDAWFIGFSPDIVVGVWVGRDDNVALYEGAEGGKVAAPIVRYFLDEIDSMLPWHDFEIPVGTYPMTVDPDTGLESKTGITEIMRTSQ